MKILFFGIYDPAYARNRILLEGLNRAGHTIIECRVDPIKYKGLSKYMALFKKGSLLAKEKFDVVLVAFPGQSIVWLAYIIFGGRRLVFDMFVSLFDSNVDDRKLYRAYSFYGLRDWFFDWYSSHLARIVLIDTKEQADYLIKTFYLSQDLIRVLPVGAVESVFYPRENIFSDRIFTIHFHGSYIPLQGIEYIITAASLCSDRPYQFYIIGDGQEYKFIQRMAEKMKVSNVSFVKRVPLEELPSYISKADICLGIFGNTDKAKRVIPNKVYEYLAMAKPVITADTPAIRSYFLNKKHMLLCKVADPHSIVEAIDELYSDSVLRLNIAQNGNRFFKEHFSQSAIVDLFRNILASVNF